MNHSGKRGRIGAVLGWVSIVGLALSCGSGKLTSTENVATATADVLVCSVSPTGAAAEYYVLPAMNHKLRSYPELAAQMGMTTVTSCDGGRAFFRGYKAYSQRHPAFDAHEGFDPLPPPPPMPSAAPPSLTIPKIAGGTTQSFGAYPLEPVVNLTWLGSGEQCTGTFIAKNWIATAAHCLEPSTICGPGNLAGSCDAGPLSAAIHTYTYQRVVVRWAAANGTVAQAVLDSMVADVLQIPEPDYLGESPGDDDVGHDFALLYLNKDIFDPVLPPDPGNGAAMRIAASEFLDTTLFVEGSAGQPPGQAFEYASVLMPSFVAGSDGQETIINAPAVGICGGDSGGPLYRLSPFGTPQNPALTPILVGTTVASNYNASDASITTCSVPGTPGVIDQWKSIYPAFAGQSFINVSMRLWNGDDFSCDVLTDLGTPDQSFAQCWGAPCDITTVPSPNPGNLRGCGPGYVCSHPGADLVRWLPPGQDACPTCGPMATDCSCVVGECLPAPPTTDDESDSGSD